MRVNVIKPVLALCGREKELPKVSQLSLTHRARGAARTGEDPRRYGSHNLRSGWITEAAGTDGVTPFDIQQVSGHVLLESVLRYMRPVNNRRPNPNRLIGR